MTSDRRDSAAARSTTSYALLGLLSVRSWTTYELAKQVQRSLKWFWPRAERKLYDEPKRLVADGLATSAREHTGQRPRTVYEITAGGREALRRWLDEPSAPRTVEFEAMIKVFFADAGSLEQLDATLVRIEQEAGTRLNELATMAAEGVAGATAFPGRLHLSAMGLRLQVEQELGVLRGSRWARDQLLTWSAADEPGEWDHRAALVDVIALARSEPPGERT